MRHITLVTAMLTAALTAGERQDPIIEALEHGERVNLSTIDRRIDVLYFQISRLQVIINGQIEHQTMEAQDIIDAIKLLNELSNTYQKLMYERYNSPSFLDHV